ncbi:aminotransferase class I/II-fold pyridoxal phosphate-dependent enzyme [Hugenholtzia roseola]|uniref:aminotransferase class I/II-fold pyridoxal phosphate-dependent enzyme n=1 Tax=Hugenholtzia roseola TaxID=1002 RepID=UPI000417A99D|nr:8-amino-7-oxononanoate synthase [Hugenholtzia roseola]
MRPFPASLEKALQQRALAGNLRSLQLAMRKGIDFYSNDYLGLAQNEILNQKIRSEYEKLVQKKDFFQYQGATGSRLLSGNYPYLEEAEAFCADFFKSETALFFASGYHANSALLSALPTRHDLILYDSLVHASLKEGYRLSFAEKKAFAHNDFDDLEKKLQQFRKQKSECYIILESLYSMDGDKADIKTAVALANHYQAYLILDEAHTTGIWGETGQGCAVALGLEGEILARVHTFGKAIGAQGAVVCGSQALKSYLVNFALPFIYSTAPPLFQVLSVVESLTFIQKNTYLIKKLQENIDFFGQKIQKKGANMPFMPESPIQTVPQKGNLACKTKAKKLQEKGFELRPILSPTVREGQERLRVCLHAFNTHQEIEQLVEAICENN